MANRSVLLNFTTECPTNRPTSSTEYEILELPHVVILCTVLGVASVLGTLGNSLVLLSIIKFDSLREIPDLFIFSLSFSDFIVTAVYQPLKAYRFAHLQLSSTNVELLTITRFLGFLSLIASVTNMLGVTVERLISIRFPMKYDLVLTRRRAVTTLICIWIFSATLVIMVSTKLLSSMYIASYFTMALIGTVSIYVYIFLIAKRLEDSAIQIQNGSHDDGRPNRRQERKAAKTIAIILGVAIGCWLPFLTVPHFISEEPDFNRYLKIFFSLQALSICNSSINPYIYCARSRRYFVAFVKLLGLRRVLKMQGTVAPAYSPRNPAMNVRDAPEEIQDTEV
ncbi:adrenocorticotropic hormone receptor-like [Oculina patagonica]